MPARNRAREVRNAAAAQVAPKAAVARPAVPKPPAARERRVAPNVKVDLTTAPTSKPPVRKAVAEKRVAPAPKAKPVPKKHEAVGTPKSVLERLYHTVTLLDENGPEITELVVESFSKAFPSIETHEKAGNEVRLALMNKGISRTVKGTGTTLDGEKFAFARGELVLVAPHKSGGCTVYSLKTTEPVEAQYDAKAAKNLDYQLIPTDPTEFDSFVTNMAKTLEGMGLNIVWATA